jgi:hypothetical protein
MSPAPAARCTACGFTWNSAAMADGLRLIGSCPKCDGALEFNADAEPERRFDAGSAARPTAPHLVLGIPRR